jgi:hypothetical protein
VKTPYVIFFWGGGESSFLYAIPSSVFDITVFKRSVMAAPRKPIRRLDRPGPTPALAEPPEASVSHPKRI